MSCRSNSPVIILYCLNEDAFRVVLWSAIMPGSRSSWHRMVAIWGTERYLVHKICRDLKSNAQYQADVSDTEGVTEINNNVWTAPWLNSFECFSQYFHEFFVRLLLLADYINIFFTYRSCASSRMSVWQYLVFC